MDPIKHLQETMEESLEKMNRDAMRKLAAQITATVSQLQNGDPSSVTLVWEKWAEPTAIRQFIMDNWEYDYVYAVLLPTGRATTDLELNGLKVVSLDLPQNKLLLYYHTKVNE